MVVGFRRLGLLAGADADEGFHDAGIGLIVTVGGLVLLISVLFA